MKAGTDRPDSVGLELPLLSELSAIGGSDERRYVLGRIWRYFPRVKSQEDTTQTDTESQERRRFGRLASRATKRLEARGELRRERTRLVLTEKGKRRVEEESLRPDPPRSDSLPKDEPHREIQCLLVDLGESLGLCAEAEFDTYDVVWRTSPAAPRLSHVFEVQVRGSVDGALARLKRAYEIGRSNLFLILADERSTRFARGRLATAFPEIAPHVRLVGIGELRCLTEALWPHRGLLLTLLQGG